MEAETKETSGVTRGQNAVHVMPPDWSAAERVITSLLERIAPDLAETQLLVVTADAEPVTAVGAPAVVNDRSAPRLVPAALVATSR